MTNLDTTHSARARTLPLVIRRFAVLIAFLGLLILCALAVFGAWSMTVRDARYGSIGWTYPYSAYLVDYSTGFIRRGAIGAVVGYFAHGRPRLLPISWLLFVNYVALMVCVATLILLNASRKLATAILVFLLPSGIVMSGVMGGFFVWKEAFFLTALAALGCAYNLIVRLPSPAVQRVLARALIVVLLIISVFASLAQETFIFLAAPAFAYLLIALIRIAFPSHPADTRFSIWYLIAMLAMFLVVGVFSHGGPAQLSQMWQHLNPADRNLYPPGKSGDMEVIGFTVSNQLNTIAHIVTSGYTWWYLSPMALFFVYCTAIACFVGGNARRWSVAYLLIILCASPMFVIGADYGRWVMMIQMSFLITLLTLGRQKLASIRILPVHIPSVERTLDRFESFCDRLVHRHAVAVIAALLLLTLTFRMPIPFVTDPMAHSAEGDFPAAVIYQVRSIKHLR